MVRGCGSRQPGGLYVCCGLSPKGKPIEHFLVDPPVPYEYGSFRSPVLIEKEEVNHILLWVGAEYYPYVTDFIEETRRFGVSKRIPKNFPIEKLTRGSMMFLVHPEAIIENYGILPNPVYCPKNKAEHFANEEYCLGHGYQIARPDQGDSKRKIGDTVYNVTPSEVKEDLVFKAGIFGRFPITNFDYITKDGHVDQSISAKIPSVSLPVNFAEE
ncbi:MAG: hypothetical protein IBX72_15185 [Nitrospirae bacterium]|nr:hypothetical protein [Nitrospirota bacterium]